METGSSRVTSKCQVVIPKKLRDKYDITPATTIHWVPREEGLLLVPEQGDVIKSARGMLKGSNLLKVFLREKKLEKRRENQKIDRKG
jgi:bifunctional DNA-binding transcriptional regulator/antitoxin component of YhaV-PrlF toxin-antitoxin module